MAKLLYFLLLITALSAFKNINDKWRVSSSYQTCPITFPYDISYLNVNTINNSTGDTIFEVYYGNNNTKSQNCTVVNYSINCGILTNNYSCSPKGMFENTTSIIEVTFDFNKLTRGSQLQSIPLTIRFNWTTSMKKNKTCLIQGVKENIIFPNDTYRVIECLCPACCYKIGSQIKFTHVEEYHNRQMVSIEGVLEGQYCENTMKEKDTCMGSNFRWNYNASNNNFNGSSLNCNQTNCGGKDLVWTFNRNVSNVIGDHVFLYWDLGDGCSLYARKDVS